MREILTTYPHGQIAPVLQSTTKQNYRQDIFVFEFSNRKYLDRLMMWVDVEPKI